MGPEAQGPFLGNLWLWVPHPSSLHLNSREGRMLQHWCAINPVSSLLGHHKYRPRLLPGVNVHVTALLGTRIDVPLIEAFFMAWTEADFQCPVEGCETLDSGKDKRGHLSLPRPTAAPEGMPVTPA